MGVSVSNTLSVMSSLRMSPTMILRARDENSWTCSVNPQVLDLLHLNRDSLLSDRSHVHFLRIVGRGMETTCQIQRGVKKVIDKTRIKEKTYI
jgi:hypothetical protein